jgi:hypothetical protein
MTRRVLVVTSPIHPPIARPMSATRNHVWQAALDGYKPGDPIGRGPSEADAVYDLYMQIEEREADA